MSEGLNVCLVMGNLTDEPALRFTQGGTAVLNFRVAAGERYQDKDKEWKDRTEYVNVVVWGKRGESLGKILQKGSGVVCQGKLRTSSYEAPDGTKRWKTEVHCDEVRLTGGRPRGGDAGDDAGAPPQRGAGQRSGGSSGGGYGGSGGGRTGGRNHSPPADDFGGGDMDDVPFIDSGMRHDLRRCGF